MAAPPALQPPTHPPTPLVQAYHELLSEIEAPLEALCGLDGTAEELLGALDDAGPHDLLQALDQRVAEAEAGGMGA